MTGHRRSLVGEASRRKHRKVPWLLAGGAFMFVISPVVLFAGAGNPPCSTPTSVGAAAGHAGYEETVYGPPWGGINGGGTTATMIDLRAGQPMLEIAVDPNVLALRSYYHVWPNPFGSHGAFLAGDTGGAIIGKHIDTYDWLGRANQNAWGVHYGVSVTKAADPGAGNAVGQVQAPASTPSAVQAECSQLAGVQVAPGQYVDPFRSSTSIYPSRIDMGVDYSGTGPIDAIGNATITYSAPGGVGWGPYSCSGGYGGAVTYRLTDGPDTGRYVYVTEGIIPTVTAGQQVRAGQQIATFTGCIETGWATGVGANTMAAALGQACTSGDAGCASTWCGNNMSQLLHALGAPAGIPQGQVSGTGCA